MRLVVDESDVVVGVIEQRRRPPAQLEPRQRERRAAELRVDLLEVVAVEVAVAAGPDEIADAEVALLRDQVGQQRVRSDVERHAEEDVAAALVELAGQPARRRRRTGRTRGRAAASSAESRRRSRPTRSAAANRGCAGSPRRRWRSGRRGRRRASGQLRHCDAVDRPQVAVGVGPLVPDRHAGGLQRRARSSRRAGTTAARGRSTWCGPSSSSPAGTRAARSKRIWYPNTDSVPVPVRSSLRWPWSRTCRMKSRYWRMAKEGAERRGRANADSSGTRPGGAGPCGNGPPQASSATPRRHRARRCPPDACTEPVRPAEAAPLRAVLLDPVPRRRQRQRLQERAGHLRRVPGGVDDRARSRTRWSTSPARSSSCRSCCSRRPRASSPTSTRSRG